MPSLQTHSLNYGQHLSTTYTRADLGIDTAMIESTPDGRWTARLIYGPDTDEHTTETVKLESTADQLATEHSLTF